MRIRQHLIRTVMLLSIVKYEASWKQANNMTCAHMTCALIVVNIAMGPSFLK